MSAAMKIALAESTVALRSFLAFISTLRRSASFQHFINIGLVLVSDFSPKRRPATS